MKNLLLKTILVATLAFTGAANAANINLNLVGTATKGSMFTVEVWANDLFDGLSSTEQLFSFGFNVNNSSPSLFTLNSVDIGTSFIDESSSTGLDAAGSSFPGIANSASTQSLLLASLNFMANEAGSGSMSLIADLVNFEGLVFSESLLPQDINASLDIDVAAVPLPASLPLALAGFGLLGVMRRKK